MKKHLMILVVLMISLVGCTEPSDVDVDTSEEMDAELTVLSDELYIPWSIEKHEETFYITEREGTIVKLENGAFERQAVQLEYELSTAAEAGLLGFVLEPNFDENNQAFAYYTYEGETGPTNKVVRLQLNENQWIEESVLLDEIPSGSYHHGGRIKIGPDDKLYVTTGDATIPELAQDLDSLAGKVLRLNLDGSIPEDNPFSDSYVYSYGHRNPQGLVWLPDGRMYASEHGDRANDEINQIELGNNYGWPLIEGTQKQESLVSPEFTSGSNTTWAPSGMATHDENIYVAGLRGNAVYVFDLASGESFEYLTDYGRIRDVYIKDDFLYFITNNQDGRGVSFDNNDYFYRIRLEELE